MLLSIGILNILCGSDREFVLGVNTSLGRLQYTCGHESYEEKPFNYFNVYINMFELKKDCKSSIGFIVFRSRVVYTSITIYHIK